MRNHYLPKYYLRGFTDPGNRDIITRITRWTMVVLRTSLERVGYESDFYSPLTERFLSDEIENRGNVVIEKIRNGESIETADREALTDYLIAQWRRVPKGKQRIADRFKVEVPSYFEGVTSEIRSQIERDPERADRGKAVLAEIERINREGRIAPEQIWEHIIRCESSPLVRNALLSMTWRFVAAPKEYFFITSDDPVFFFDHLGVGRPESDLTFPISSTISLWMNWKPVPPAGYHQAKPALVKELNRRQVHKANKYIFCQSADPKIIALTAKKVRLNLLQ